MAPARKKRSTRRTKIPRPDLGGFDPEGAVPPTAGIFGLDTKKDESLVHLVPVPFEATASYGRGSSRAPRAMLKASHQLDFHDPDLGRPYERGIHLLPESRAIRTSNAEAMKLVDGLRRVKSPRERKRRIDRVNAICSRVHERVEKTVAASIESGHVVGTLGGDHSVAFGSIAAHAKLHRGLGVLWIDAHHDLREAYEGFTWSHASVAYNVLERIPAVRKIVQVGVRDLARSEADRCRRSRRMRCTTDRELRRELFRGKSFDTVVKKIVGALPEHVYVSFDIDGLSPHLCPNTGTPVPGGLEFEEARHLLAEIPRSGRRIVGFDLVEVSPGRDEWDANVGARVLYGLIGLALTDYSPRL